MGHPKVEQGPKMYHQAISQQVTWYSRLIIPAGEWNGPYRSLTPPCISYVPSDTSVSASFSAVRGNTCLQGYQVDQ